MDVTGGAVKYTVRGGEWIVQSREWDSFEKQVCTVTEAVEAFKHVATGPGICKARGDHDYSERVPQTSNMYLCFRCGEPGWLVPSLGDLRPPGPHE